MLHSLVKSMKMVRIMIVGNLFLSLFVIIAVFWVSHTANVTIDTAVGNTDEKVESLKLSMEEQIDFIVEACTATVMVDEPVRLTETTIMVSMLYEQNGDFIRELSGPIPEYLIGMTREQCMNFFQTVYDSHVENVDERVVLNADLTAFSETEIVIRKFCDNMDSAFFVTSFEGKVIIYQKDRTTVFQTTEVLIQDLPTEEQIRIGEGFYLYSADELFAYLESLTS